MCVQFIHMYSEALFTVIWKSIMDIRDIIESANSRLYTATKSKWIWFRHFCPKSIPYTYHHYHFLLHCIRCSKICTNYRYLKVYKVGISLSPKFANLKVLILWLKRIMTLRTYYLLSRSVQPQRQIRDYKWYMAFFRWRTRINIEL